MIQKDQKTPGAAPDFFESVARTGFFPEAAVASL